MLGKGLESLIPKKKDGGNVPSQSAHPQEGNPSQQHVRREGAPHLGGTHFRSPTSQPQRYASRPPEPPQESSMRGEEVHEHEEMLGAVRNFHTTFSQAPKKQQGEAVFQIETDKIVPNPYQPRKEFNEEALQELADSIREFGVIQPLVVSKVVKETETGTHVEYQLIAGERRLMASKRIGLPRVPAIVKKVDTHRMKLELALIENIQRSNLNRLEEARAYARLQDEFGLTQREIAIRVGKSREVVANTLRLLNLPEEIQSALMQNKINESQARTLLSIENREAQIRAFHNLLSEKMSVRAFREKVHTGTDHAPQDPQGTYWEKQLEEKLGSPVKIVKHGPQGKMVIQFYSEDEWQGILNKLLGENLDR